MRKDVTALCLLAVGVQLDAGVVAIILLMGRVWDAISDPFAGYLTTKTNTRWGRLRPWVAGSIVPLSCAYTALWCVPDWEPNWKIVYVTVCYFTYQTCISTYVFASLRGASDASERKKNDQKRDRPLPCSACCVAAADVPSAFAAPRTQGLAAAVPFCAAATPAPSCYE